MKYKVLINTVIGGQIREAGETVELSDGEYTESLLQDGNIGALDAEVPSTEAANAEGGEQTAPLAPEQVASVSAETPQEPPAQTAPVQEATTPTAEEIIQSAMTEDGR